MVVSCFLTPKTFISEPGVMDYLPEGVTYDGKMSVDPCRDGFFFFPAPLQLASQSLVAGGRG